MSAIPGSWEIRSLLPPKVLVVHATVSAAFANRMAATDGAERSAKRTAASCSIRALTCELVRLVVEKIPSQNAR